MPTNSRFHSQQLETPHHLSMTKEQIRQERCATRNENSELFRPCASCDLYGTTFRNICLNDRLVYKDHHT